MVFPKFLLDMELNETTKLLYMLLLDRARLSLKNEGWTDTSGHVFLYFTIDAMAEVLHKSQMTIKTSLAALERQDLILSETSGSRASQPDLYKIPGRGILPDRQDSFPETDRNCPADRQDSSLRQTENCPVIRKREIRTIYQKERARGNALPMANFKMYSCQKRNWKKSDSRFQTGRNISNGYPATWLPLESTTKTMQHHHQLGKAGQSPFPAKYLRK